MEREEQVALEICASPSAEGDCQKIFSPRTAVMHCQDVVGIYRTDLGFPSRAVLSELDGRVTVYDPGKCLCSSTYSCSLALLVFHTPLIDVRLLRYMVGITVLGKFKACRGRAWEDESSTRDVSLLRYSTLATRLGSMPNTSKPLDLTRKLAPSLYWPFQDLQEDLITCISTSSISDGVSPQCSPHPSAGTLCHEPCHFDNPTSNDVT